MAEPIDPQSDPVRVDVWLWSVRAFKTRSLACDACKKGQVTIRGISAKPSRQVRIGDEIIVEGAFLTRTLKVVGLLTRRVGASLVPNYCEDLTPAEEVEAARRRYQEASSTPSREEGAGRPTKKERRELDEVETGLDESDEALRQELFEKLMRRSGL